MASIAMIGGVLADDVKPLRLCADPTNLPFSSSDSAQPGIYIEIGRAIAEKLGRPVAYNWYKSYFGKRTVRETLLGKQCDMMVGLPLVDDFMGPAVIFSKPFGSEGYALVAAKGRTPESADALKGLRVAVQYQTTPQNLLAQRDDVTKVTVLSPDEGMKALDAGKVDAAFVWGPVAGWLNHHDFGDRYDVRNADGDGLIWQTAIGFAKGSKELRDQVNAVLPDLAPTIATLFTKYGAPSGTPLRFGSADANVVKVAASDASPPAAPAASPAVAKSDDTSAIKAEPAKAGDGNPAKGKVSAGHELFNGTCAHCHGPDAVQSERKIDLRLLQKRYGADMQDMFWKTVHEGRPAKGMPTWKEVFSDEDLASVLAYLQTVQTPPN